MQCEKQKAIEPGNDGNCCPPHLFLRNGAKQRYTTEKYEGKQTNVDYIPDEEEEDS